MSIESSWPMYPPCVAWPTLPEITHLNLRDTQISGKSLAHLCMPSTIQSWPKVLDRVPLRIAHSRKSDRLALVDDEQLKPCQQEVWRTYGPDRVMGWGYRQFAEGNFDTLEQTLAILESQTRLGFGCSPETLRTLILDGMRYRLAQLLEKEPDSALLKQLTEWKATGNTTALLVEALGQYGIAWDACGSGYASTVSQTGWAKYSENAKLESEGGLDDVDLLASRATELFPGEIKPHRDIMFKLMPQWYDEPGDAASFGLQVLGCKFWAASFGLQVLDCQRPNY